MQSVGQRHPKATNGILSSVHADAPGQGGAAPRRKTSAPCSNVEFCCCFFMWLGARAAPKIWCSCLGAEGGPSGNRELQARRERHARPGGHVLGRDRGGSPRKEERIGPAQPSSREGPPGLCLLRPAASESRPGHSSRLPPPRPCDQTRTLHALASSSSSSRWSLCCGKAPKLCPHQGQSLARAATRYLMCLVVFSFATPGGYF